MTLDNAQQLLAVVIGTSKPSQRQMIGDIKWCAHFAQGYAKFL
jgi:hypothetical protein